MKRNIDGININKNKKTTEKRPVAKKTPREIARKKDTKNHKKEKQPKIKITLPTRESMKNKKKVRLLISFAVLIILFIGAYFILSALDRTKILIQLRHEAVILNQEIKAYKQPTENQLGFDIIALSGKQSIAVQATQKEEVLKKASGKIAIFNKFSSEPQRLAPETRFETPDGKIYKLGKSGITIPGKKSDTEPGSIEVTVYADKGGEDYNIGLTDFTIPGFKEANAMDRYNNIYALSKTAMTGGFSGEKGIITEHDRKRAENELKSRLMEKLVSAIERQKTKDFLLVPDSIAFSFNKIAEGQEGENITLNQEGIAVAVLINKLDLADFLSKRIFIEEQGDGIVIEDTKKIILKPKQNYTSQELANLKTINLQVTGKILALWSINEEKMKEKILGLAREFIYDQAKENPGIDIMKVVIRPPWRSRASESLDKIKIKLQDLETDNL